MTAKLPLANWLALPIWPNDFGAYFGAQLDLGGLFRGILVGGATPEHPGGGIGRAFCCAQEGRQNMIRIRIRKSAQRSESFDIYRSSVPNKEIYETTRLLEFLL